MNTRQHTVNLAASVRARLQHQARQTGADHGLLLTKYALERLLYRLSISDWRDDFLLKGALLFDLWFDEPCRPTRDIDLLGISAANLGDVAAAFRAVCALACADGIHFDPQTVQSREIRKEASGAGIRVTLLARLDSARCAVQIDIGYGDAVTPAAQRVSYPVLLEGMAAPVLRAYPAETVVAEKYQAIVSLGMVNTRLKDYFDLWVLAKHVQFDPAMLRKAIQATFARRGTPLPQTLLPLGLSDTFAQDANKIQQWNAFLGKNKLKAPALPDLIAELRPLLWRDENLSQTQPEANRTEIRENPNT